jgi:endonuclease-3
MQLSKKGIEPGRIGKGKENEGKRTPFSANVVERVGKTRSQAIRILELVRKAVHTRTALKNISSQQSESSSDEEKNNPFRVLVSTILSARTRDPVTEEVAGRLFLRFPDSRSLSEADEKEVSQLIKPVNYYNVKTRRIIDVSKVLVSKYGGSVPHTFAELLELPGVGRKTANCVLVYAYNTPAIPVDIHVHRISNRIGLVHTRTPEQTEAELSKAYERKHWLDVNELFVAFGQTICKPTVPRCKVCPVRPLCNYYQNEVKTGKRPSSA